MAGGGGGGGGGRQERLVVPSVEMGKSAGNIRTWLVDIAHDGHHGADAMKSMAAKITWASEYTLEAS